MIVLVILYFKIFLLIFRYAHKVIYTMGRKNRKISTVSKSIPKTSVIVQNLTDNIVGVKGGNGCIFI